MNELTKRIITSLIFGTLFFGSYFACSWLFSSLLIAILVFTLIFEWPKLLPPCSLEFWLITPIYPILPVLSLLYLNFMYYPLDKIIPLYPFLISWASDTGSFIVGKSMGRNKICPRVSPGKTWEGLAGGILSVTATNFLLRAHSELLRSNFFFKTTERLIVLSIALAVFGFLGDIFISFLKRRQHLKDSGSILPGHGGILDRFDSVFFVVVVILPIFLSIF